MATFEQRIEQQRAAGRYVAVVGNMFQVGSTKDEAYSKVMRELVKPCNVHYRSRTVRILAPKSPSVTA